MRVVKIVTILAIPMRIFGQFTDVSSSSTNTDVGGAKDGGLSFADFNEDGCLDILVNT